MSTLKEHIIQLQCCWGSFKLSGNGDGQWFPNFNLNMSVEEQRHQNVENGYMTEDGRML